MQDPPASQPSATDTSDIATNDINSLADDNVSRQSYDGSGANSAEEVHARSAMQKQLQSFKSGLKDISSSVRELATAGSASRQRAVNKNSGNISGGSPEQQDSPARPTLPSEGGEQQHLPCATVFENERYQPIRGWGHTWPGHFMPRDYSHWSIETDESSMVRHCLTIDGWATCFLSADSNMCSGMLHVQVFRDVCPALPDGYHWVDEEWAIDMSGLEDEAVDGDGWSYGIHWNKLTSPPQPGSGKRKGASFVRRRK